MAAVADESPLRELLESVLRARQEVDRPSSLAVLEVDIRAGQMPPLHVHDQDEAFHVLEGRMLVHAGSERVALGAGDAYVARAGLPHTYEAASEGVRYLSMTFARSVELYGSFLRAAAKPSPGAAEVHETTALDAIARANDIVVLGPPGSLPGERLKAPARPTTVEPDDERGRR
jgi:quercetin dioxygenase-like cupin family protein